MLAIVSRAERNQTKGRSKILPPLAVGVRWSEGFGTGLGAAGAGNAGRA